MQHLRYGMVVALTLIVAVAVTQLSAQSPAEPPADEAAAEATEPGAGVPGELDQPAEADPEVTTGMALLLKLRQGGITMIFLVGLSIFGLAYTIERAVNLRRGVIVPAGFAPQADRLWSAGQFDKLQQLCRQNNSILARMIAVMAAHRTEDPDRIATVTADLAARGLKSHTQRAYALAVVATIGPLLGLLGTVIGMIGAFDKVAAAGSLGDASLLGADISKALITTGAGLAIAVPALALYHFFKTRTSMFALMLEEQASDLMARWFLFGQQTTPVHREAQTPPPPATPSGNA